MHEGRVVPESQEPDAHPVQDVDHPGDARVLPERHDPLALGVHHGLIVHTPVMTCRCHCVNISNVDISPSPDILLEHGVHQVHVVRLGLDCVREETEGFV